MQHTAEHNLVTGKGLKGFQCTGYITGLYELYRANPDRSRFDQLTMNQVNSLKVD